MSFLWGWGMGVCVRVEVGGGYSDSMAYTVL